MLTSGTILTAVIGTGGTPAQAAAWKYTLGDPQGNDSVSDVVAIGRRDAWAVGSRTVGSQERPLVYRWNGRSWRTVQAPTAPIGLAAVDASSARDVWAFGTDLSTFDVLATHWNGSRWTTTKIDNDLAVFDTDVVSPRDVWLAGEGQQGGPHNLKHWDGRAWRNLSLPGQIFALDMPSARRGWAAGTSDGQPSVLRWDGTRWRSVPTPRYGVPQGGQAQLLDVLALSANDVWAVGTMYWPVGDDEEHRPIAMHWNGHRWSKVAVGSYAEGLSGLAADGRGGLWSRLGAGTTLLHYAQGRWTRVELPRPAEADTDLSGRLAHVPGTTTTLGVGTVFRWGAPEDDHSDGIFYRYS
jgi:hypothetical protein